jgi:hypothetical protein
MRLFFDITCPTQPSDEGGRLAKKIITLLKYRDLPPACERGYEDFSALHELIFERNPEIGELGHL